MRARERTQSSPSPLPLRVPAGGVFAGGIANVQRTCRKVQHRHAGVSRRGLAPRPARDWVKEGAVPGGDRWKRRRRHSPRRVTVFAEVRLLSSEEAKRPFSFLRPGPAVRCRGQLAFRDPRLSRRGCADGRRNAPDVM
ncbi:hypothetical protein SKAU_G00304500 [Synaphobranchus kaupii]|uniref:Uncharacterized protein n=1 Tax=Synaphobranchus kaupii TaxID=118154 RepID=A0A9Q1IMM3_SYNKA|nr:hypothetical protein SKAU_G00304500 [Synaphobranchus kaupii]